MKRTLLYRLLLCPALLFAQKESPDVRKGNRQYNKEQYTDAEIDYRKGLDKNNTSFEAHFNLGDALFKQEKYPEAAEEFQKAGALIQPKNGKYSESDKKKLAQVYHNLGNSLYAQQQYDKAVASYKQSLMANPKDDETRYNLELCKRLQKQQQQQQQQQQKKDDEQKKDEQKKDDQKKDDQKKKDEQKKKEQQQDQRQQMSRENAEQLLNAAIQEEKNTQERLKKAQQQPQRRKHEKNW